MTTQEKELLEAALKWWNSLTEHGRSQFQTPKSNDDIIAYYENPAEHCYDSLKYMH